MLFRKSTCWYRQASLITNFHPSSDFGSHINGKNNKTQPTINNNRIMKEVDKKYIENVQGLKTHNLHKMNEEGNNRNRDESNQVPINYNFEKMDLS
mgnify:CR=1 FL=1